MQQDMHLHCCASLVLSFFILYPEKCYMCCDGRNKNEIKINNTYSVECNALIQTKCANKKEITCKMDTVPANHDDCFTSSVTDELTDQHIHILGKDTCIKHRKKKYEVNGIHLSIREYGYYLVQARDVISTYF
uniref:TNFR-Cys domain-containing protein n=1 Tax=Magallana gigas TaxID=29159 RepID=A0A8W8M002_MAGGI